MPHTLLRLTLLLNLALVASLILPITNGVAASDATPVASPAGVEDVYRDPDGRFEVPIPTGWTATPRDGYLDIVAPEGEYHAYVAAVPETDMAAAALAVWEMVRTEGAPALVDQQEIPSLPGIDGTLIQIYDAGPEGTQSHQAYVQLVGDTSYVLLTAGDLEIEVRRSSQIMIIASGFQVLSVESTDLLGVRPMRYTPEMLAELTEYIEQQMNLQDVPGAAIAIVQDGEIVYRQGFGVRELGKDDPVTPETLMMVGSVTKSMTTMMMATVVDDGLMSWDTPAIEILPSFAVADPELSEQITMRQLVCACTGVPRRDMQFMFNASEMDPADTIASLADFPFFTPIGEAFQYSNQMVAVGGYITSLAAGGSLPTLAADYESAMLERVFGPIGMEHTTLDMAEAAANPNHASSHGYEVDGLYHVQPLSAEELLAPVAPAAMAWSNVDDLSLYLMTLMADGIAPGGERVVSAENLSETWRPQVPINSTESYGLGWTVGTFRNQPVIKHSGNMIGFTSDLSFLPESDLGVVILTNGALSNLFTDAVRTRAYEIAFGLESDADEYIEFVLEQVDEQVALAAAAIGETPSTDEVAPFLGQYVSPVFGEVWLTYEDGRLLFDAGEFQGEVRPVQGEAAQVAGYMLIDGPAVSLLLNIRMDNGTPALEMIDRITLEVNTFTLVESYTATPLATPVP